MQKLLRFSKDILSSFIFGMGALLLCLLLTVLVAVPLVALISGLTWCLVQITGISSIAAQLWILGTGAAIMVTVCVYQHKRETDQWIQNIRDEVDAAVATGLAKATEMETARNAWSFPLKDYHYQIPAGEDHRGAFGAIRKHDIHTGVDLYCPEGTPIYAVEDGQTICCEIFTGPRAESPWWNETFSVLVEGKSGIVCYGEIAECLPSGLHLKQGDLIGTAKQVLKKDKGKPMCMLHFELYNPGVNETVWWKKDEPRPDNLLDPTEHLARALDNMAV